MSVCPVCKYHHQQEVSKCQRCSWSMQDNLYIDPKHPILTACIPTLVERLTNKIIQYEKLNSILQDIDLQESNSRKLDEIQEQFVNLQEIINNKIVEKLELIIQEKQPLKVILEEENVSSIDNDASPTNHIESQNIAIEDNNSESFRHNYVEPSNLVSLPLINNNSSNNLQFLESDRHISKNSNLIDESPKDSLYNSSSDRYPNDDFGSINELEQASLYDLPDDARSEYAAPNREYGETINPSENSEPETNSQGNYHNFYRLIEQQEIEVTKVTVTKETMEKMRSGTQSNLEFSNDRRGNYLIINWQDVYCLIPKEKLNINPYQYGNFQRVFNCQDYRETYRDFEVIEPATVISCDREIWQLENKGKIKFI